MHRFVSKHRNLQIWLEPPKEEYTVDGRRSVISPGILVEFTNGYYETDDDEIANRLRASELYGIFFEEYKAQPTEELSQKESVITSITKPRRRTVVEESHEVLESRD